VQSTGTADIALGAPRSRRGGAQAVSTVRNATLAAQAPVWLALGTSAYASKTGGAALRAGTSTGPAFGSAVALPHGMALSELSLSSLRFADRTASKHIGDSTAAGASSLRPGGLGESGAMSLLALDETSPQGAGGQARAAALGARGSGPIRTTSPMSIDPSTQVLLAGAEPAPGAAPTSGAAPRRARPGNQRGGHAADPARAAAIVRAMSRTSGTGRAVLDFTARLAGLRTPRDLKVGEPAGFSHDLLVRLEGALDAMSAITGGSDPLRAASRSGAPTPLVASNDLGSSTVANMAWVSPAAHAASSRPTGATGEGRSPRRGASSTMRVGAATPQPSASRGEGDALSFVAPSVTQTEAGRPTANLGGLFRAARSGSTRQAATELPLIAPATAAVARHAQLSAQGEQVADQQKHESSGEEKPKSGMGQAKARVDLDKLALELANRISLRARVELERRGIWRAT
jgi:hypothetical protein